MKAYVAAKFERKDEAREVQRALTEDGHVITADWTTKSAAGLSGQRLCEYLTTAAEYDLEGVRACDVLVLLHDDACRGGFAELGIAVALDKLVVVIGGRTRPCPIFYHLSTVHHFDDLESARRWILWCEKTFMGGVSERSNHIDCRTCDHHPGMGVMCEKAAVRITWTNVAVGGCDQFKKVVTP